MQEVEQCRSNCREARVTPLQHALSESAIQHALGAEEIEYLVAQRLAEGGLGQGWQHPQRAGGQEYTVGHPRMDMRVEGHEIAASLHVQQGVWPGYAGRHHGWCSLAD